MTVALRLLRPAGAPAAARRIAARTAFVRLWWCVASASPGLVAACGPGSAGAECEPGVLDVVKVQTASDVATLARVETVTELHVVESELVDLSGFECLRQAEKIYVERNPLLKSLDGLDGLVEVVGRLDEPDDDVGAEFMLRDNDALVDLSALSSLRTVEGTLEISRNAALAEVVDLGALEITSRSFVISENPSLEVVRNLDAYTGGLHEQDFAGVFLQINDNLALQAVAFPSTKIKAEGIEIQRNPELIDLSMHIFCSPFWFTIADNPALLRLPVSIHDSTKPSPSLLCSDRTVAYMLSGVPSVTDLTALPRAVGLAKLEIRGNPGLRGLEGLEELKRVGELIIDDNPALESLAGLDPAKGGQIQIVDELFVVRNNPTLNQCDANALAEMLLAQSQELSVEIAGNGGACQ